LVGEKGKGKRTDQIQEGGEKGGSSLQRRGKKPALFHTEGETRNREGGKYLYSLPW